MTTANLTTLLLIISPFALLITSVLSYLQPGKKPVMLMKASTYSAAVGFVAAVIALILLWLNGANSYPLMNIGGQPISLRLDAISGLMLLMVCLIGWIVMRYSVNYLDGDDRQGLFTGRLAAALAFVQLLIVSDHLIMLLACWIATSISLQRLLTYYPERPGAIIAARKKFVIARISDICLALSFWMIYQAFGTMQLSQIFDQIANGLAEHKNLEWALILLALAAMTKSAQLPVHGWIVEVMETPTPVSALLHAGLLNAGPYLLIRLAPVWDLGTAGPALLLVISGLTALIGSLIFMTQTSIKTALSYSSIAHMGFSLLLCSIGLYAAAMLHLLAHSIYKAHAFLSSGSIIDQLRVIKSGGAHAVVTWKAFLGGLAVGGLCLLAMVTLWQIHLPESMSLFFLSAIICLGIARFATTVLASGFLLVTLVKGLAMSLLVGVCFLSLESVMSLAFVHENPSSYTSFGIEGAILAMLLILYTSAVIFQIFQQRWAGKDWYFQLSIHLRNGLYINTLMDRMTGALKLQARDLPESSSVESLLKNLKLQEQNQQ